MRKTNEYGISESSEFISELDDLFCDLCDRELLSREAVALIDVYDAIGIIEGDGLHQFWEGSDDPDQVIESFKLVGAVDVANLIASTSWMIAIINQGTDRDGQYKFNKNQDQEIRLIEESIYEKFIGLPTRLLVYAKSNNIC